MANFRTEILHGSKSEPERTPRIVRIAPGIAIYSPIRLLVDDWDGFDLELDVTAQPATEDRAGRFVCRTLTVRQREDGPPVTSEVIRGIPVATLLRGVGARHWWAYEQTGEQTYAMDDRRLDQEALARLKVAGPTDEALRWVAYSYRMAVVLGDPPTRAVETELELPRSTAGRWVAMARDRGFLGRSEGPGKAGG